MIKLTTQEIKMQQAAQDKLAVIRAIAADLAEKGLVSPEYLTGMLEREEQSSTFLGSGIAIPHGTTATRDMVHKTGVVIHHFPNGVEWGDNNRVYVAIGIAAKSDEHLTILRQLTKVLASEGVTAALQGLTSKQQLLDLLSGNHQLSVDFQPAAILKGFPATDLTQLSAVAAGLLKNSGAVGSAFITSIMNQSPTHLGKGLWSVSSDVAVSRTAIGFVTAEQAFSVSGQPVKALILFAACNAAHTDALAALSKLLFAQRQAEIIEAAAPDLINMLTGQLTEPSPPLPSNKEASATETLTAQYRIKNNHGLHARPGAMLVAEAKKFAATIRVSNIDGDGQAVNAKSLMKVISMGVKHGHTLAFSAQGDDAAEALAAIGAVIESGLGEG